ncbi:MAG TPA: hypothetical protein VF364_10055 [Candidatus Limnocylindria bacterium]
MTLSRSNPRAKQRWTLLGMAIATMLLLIAGVVLAVHDEDFQLDGNVLSASTTSAGGKTQTVDWDSIFNANGTPKTLPTGFSDPGFEKDFLNTGTTFLTSDTSTFATGSKDTLGINGWQCNFDNNVNSKIDVMNAYAVSYENAAGDEIMYFGLERNTNTGDANVGFWFLQNQVGCESTGGSADFTGAHVDGDVLVVSEFSNGGTVSTINVYRWDGDDVTGSLNPNPIGSGVDCRNPATLPGDSACAAANTADITTPWLTSNFKDKVGNKLRTAEFFEGGINLTDLNLGGKCFNTFIGDTRSSTSLTATLFDFAAGTTGGCTSTTVTTPNITSAQIPGDPADAQVTVFDTAVVTVEGVDTFDASLSFHLCGPMAASSTDLCTTGGVDIGSVAVTANGSYQSPGTTFVTQAGRYCWRADFSGDLDAGVPASSDSRSSECFLITPRQPTLTTQAGAGPVDFGQPVTDTATLGNTAHQPGTGGPTGSNGSINAATLGGDADGLITFTLYKADCTTLATGTGTNPQTVTVSGNGTYGPVSFTPNAPGTYHWVASYDGDLPNTLSATHNTDCLTAAESVVVQQIPTTIKSKQSWYPNDTATVAATTGNLGAGGSVAFSLYDNATCTGTAKYTETKTITGGSASEEVSTNNTTFNITSLYTDPADTVVTYSWKIVYTPAAADTAHTGKQSACNAEHFSITYTNDGGPGTDLP